MGAPRRATEFYEFGPFLVDMPQRVLFRAGERIPLTSKVFDTLLVLLRNGGRVVEKDDLMKTIWPDTVVEENNLNQNISALRKILGEVEDGKSYIETVPRRGYRFVASVKTRLVASVKSRPEESSASIVATDASRNAPSLEPGDSPEQEIARAIGPSVVRPESKGVSWISHVLGPHFASAVEASSGIHLGRAVAATGGLLLVALALLVTSEHHSMVPRLVQARGGLPTLTQGKYVAVLPFRVVGDRAGLDYMARGLAGALSARLFGFRGLHVASATAIDRADGKGPLQSVARQLGANLLIQGELHGTAEKVRVIVDVEDVADGLRLWTGEFSGVPQDIIRIEDEISTKLVAALGLEQDNPGYGRHAAHPTENIEAYDLYLRGKDALRDRQDLSNVRAAIRFHEEALKKDPAFALAHAGLADASLEMYRLSKESFWSEKALLAAQRAEQLDGDLAEVHFVLGSVYELRGQAEGAINEEKRGLELAPDSDEGYRRLANAYLALGRKRDAIEAYKKATEINPYYWFNFNVLGHAYFRMGDCSEALQAFRRVTVLEPDNSYGYDNIGAVYIRQGKWSESIPIFQRALQLRPHFVAYSNLGTAYFYLKRYDEAAKMFEKAAEMSPNQQVVLGNLADAYRWSGQTKRAIAAYDRAIALAYKELQVNPRAANSMQSLALYYAKKGNAVEAIELIRKARAIDPDNVQFIYGEAEVMALAGQPQGALDALRYAFQKGYPPEEAIIDPELSSLRSSPQFEDLIRGARSKKT